MKSMFTGLLSKAAGRVRPRQPEPEPEPPVGAGPDVDTPAA